MSDATRQIFEIFIRTTPEQLWQAIVDPDFTRQYFFGTLVKTTARPGEAIIYTFPDGRPCVDGEVIESEPPHKLVHTWVVRYDPQLSVERSQVTWLIEPYGETCKLSVIHELSAAPKVAEHVASNGWSRVLSGLKTLLETGQPLVIELA